jgi:hypothetical protein
MRLVGKRVERLNRYGDDLCIELQKEGRMRISPALQSRMGIPNSGNKVGFAYPDTDDKDQVVNIYIAPDGNGVAVNNQGVLSNTPHNRDLRSHYEESNSDNVKLFVAEQPTEDEDFPGYRFFKIKSKSMLDTATEDYNVAVNTLEKVETFVSSQTDEDVIEHAADTTFPSSMEDVTEKQPIPKVEGNIEKNFQEDAIEEQQRIDEDAIQDQSTDENHIDDLKEVFDNSEPIDEKQQQTDEEESLDSLDMF